MNDRELAGLCKYAYENEDFAIESKETDTQVFLFSNGPSLQIVFRGTEFKWRDWLTDLRAIQKVIPYGNPDSPVRIHAGFLAAYKSVREEILLAAASELEIQVTGHSLGGALATICALDIKYNFYAKSVAPLARVSCVTFGSPKVGNRAFVESFNKYHPISRRYTNKLDVVTALPLAFWWSHVLRRFKLNNYRHGIDNYIEALK